LLFIISFQNEGSIPYIDIRDNLNYCRFTKLMNTTTFQFEAENITKEQALLVLVSSQAKTSPHKDIREQELRSLVSTMGMVSLETIQVTLRSPKAAYLIGTGKMREICAQAQDLKVDCIIFDDDLSPSQQRNWEKASGLCVIDRREVILQIFADRASTKEAVLQVALARQEYSLPRLTRAWTHLSRQRGGSKGTRGKGETQLESDRRVVTRQISKIKQELDKVRSHRDTQRKQRTALPVPTASIVGYTNAGKSSLLHALTDAEVTIEDKLFATLDPTTRRIQLPSGSEALLTDTVGFVQNLPHDLIDAFRSTLEETAYSDFLIHVIDASHPDPVACYETTLEVLGSLGCADKPSIILLNKMDLCPDAEHLAPIKQRHEHVYQVSIKSGEGIEAVREAIEELIFGMYPIESYILPEDRFDILAFMKRNGSVIGEEYRDGGIFVEARIPDRFKSAVKAYRA
jgi:GTP-binding protein HflX